MAKYDGPRDLLRRERRSVVTLTLARLSDAVPGGLPSSAHRHHAWWSNETAGSHVQARSWPDAGYTVTTVNLYAGSVTFERLTREVG